MCTSIQSTKCNSRCMMNPGPYRLSSEFESGVYAQPASKAIFRARPYDCIIFQSGDDDYLMNEIRRKLTTGRQSPPLFAKWHGIFYMPSRIDKAFDYPVAEHWAETEMFSPVGTRTENTSAHNRTRYQLSPPPPAPPTASIG